MTILGILTSSRVGISSTPSLAKNTRLYLSLNQKSFTVLSAPQNNHIFSFYRIFIKPKRLPFLSLLDNIFCIFCILRSDINHFLDQTRFFKVMGTNFEKIKGDIKENLSFTPPESSKIPFFEKNFPSLALPKYFGRDEPLPPNSPWG